MSVTNISQNNHKRTILVLIGCLLAFTIIYQLRPFLTDSEFRWISIFSYSVLPGLLTIYASVLTIKLFHQNHFQTKAVLLFALGAFCWFAGEEIFMLYENVWEGDPFPSEADIFYIISYPLFTGFLFLSLKPVISKISRNV